MTEQTMQFDSNDIAATKSLAWLSYLGIFFIIPMLVNKNSAYSKFHVNQGIVYLISTVIMYIIAMVCAIIPYIGIFLSLVIYIFIFVLAIMGIVNAASGKAKKLPLIGNIVIYK